MAFDYRLPHAVMEDFHLTVLGGGDLCRNLPTVPKVPMLVCSGDTY